MNELFNNKGDGAYSNSKIKTIVESTYKEVAKAGRKLTEGDIISKIKSVKPDITSEHLAKYAKDIRVIAGVIK